MEIETKNMAQQIDLVVLNEASLFRIVKLLIQGKTPHIVVIEPMFRTLAGGLQRLARWLMARGFVHHAEDAPLNLEYHDGQPGDSLYRPYHPAIESGVQDQLIPDKDSEALNFYRYALRKALSDYSQQMLYLSGAIVSSEAKHGGKNLALHGAPKHFERIFSLSVGRNPDCALQRVFVPKRLFNLIVSLVVFIATVLWLIVRIRSNPPTEKFLLGIDRISPIDLEIGRLGVERAEDVLVVERSKQLLAQPLAGANNFRRVTRSAAQINPGLALKLIKRAGQDLIALWQGYGKLDPELFSRFAVLAAKRAQFAAFFHRYQVTCFWGRDDYSMDHIVRSGELRALGAVSLGVNHGLPMNTYVSQWREIDFDIYYTFGPHLYESFYLNAWAKNMLVKPVGNIQMTPERQKRVGLEQTKDIAVYVIVSLNFEYFLEQMKLVAERFPERRVHMRMKAGRDPSYMRRYYDWMQNHAAPNMVDNTDPEPYELMLKTRYAITPASTAGVEAMQFGAVPFYFNLVPELQFYYFRNFPDLIVESGAEIIRRIENLESGLISFDPKKFKGLMDPQPEGFFATLHNDIKNAQKREGVTQ